MTALSDSAITLATPYAGTLTIPRDRLARLRVLEPGWLPGHRPVRPSPRRQHLDHAPLARPSLARGRRPRADVRARTPTAPRPGFVVLDVVQVVGETAGIALLEPGPEGRAADLRRRSTASGSTTSTATSRRPTRRPSGSGSRSRQDLLKPGKNVLRIEQTGIASDPTWFDDLGILQIALQFARPRPAPDRRPQLAPRNPDGRLHEDSDAEHGPARPRDRPRGRRPGDHAPRRRRRGRRRPLGPDRGRRISGSSWSRAGPGSMPRSSARRCARSSTFPISP